MIEPKTGVFVGKISAMVRDRLWEKCREKKGVGGVVQIFTMNNEQGFDIRAAGDPSRDIVDLDGLKLIKIS